jgi:hypothetical protein
MTDEIKDLIDDLRLNHEYCPKEVILRAADVIEQLSQHPWDGLTEMQIDAMVEIAIEGHAGHRDAIKWALRYAEKILMDMNS